MPHIHDRIDFTVEVLIVNNGRVLLRKHDKYNIWLGVGGHIELDEDPIEAVIREAKEESGLDIELIGSVSQSPSVQNYLELLPPRFMNRHRINSTHEHISLIYFARSKSDQIKPTGADISLETKWFSAKELKRNEYGIRQKVIDYALEALRADKEER